ncbi:hypothetical protein GIB67_029026 [Kingdonia uniflora]|uniref:Uncharacterized protein n=1 Tax=Kingdonia uniflora TaxID=39325 RepID=A0A7J7N6J4_9MAGN|nr:hypothetical protein GIB67_029026 [Kingdonia uniflora]
MMLRAQIQMRICLWILEALQGLQKPAIAAIVLGLLLTSGPRLAFAASGGTMGGSSFSSDSGSGSGSGSSSWGSSSSSGSSSWDSSDSDSGSSYWTFTASPSFSTSTPDDELPPSSSKSYSTLTISPSLSTSTPDDELPPIVWKMFYNLGFSKESEEHLSVTQRVTLNADQLHLSVSSEGLLGKVRSFQNDLDQIAETANTSNFEGLSYILKETISALLRHPDCWISFYSSVDMQHNMKDAEKCFNKLSIEKRGKFSEETLVNLNNIKRRSTRSQTPSGFSNEYIVITLLVAFKGYHKLQAINNSGDLTKALQKLGSIPTKKTLAVEVLWTPQQENDILSKQEMLEDYPLLRPLDVVQDSAFESQYELVVVVVFLLVEKRRVIRMGEEELGFEVLGISSEEGVCGSHYALGILYPDNYCSQASGLLGKVRSFQKDLDQIAETADTSTSEGLSFVLTGTTLALHRHIDCWISCHSSVDLKCSIEDGEKSFKKLSIEERGKINEETLINVNNIKRRNMRSQTSSGFSNDYILVDVKDNIEDGEKHFNKLSTEEQKNSVKRHLSMSITLKIGAR